MKATFRNRTQMNKATLLFLKNCPPAILLIIPILGIFTTALEVIVNAILAADETQATVANDAGQERLVKKNGVMKMAQSIGRAIMSFAANSGNNDLENLMNSMLKKMEEKADLVFIQRCTTILGAASDNSGALTPYGVTAEVITAYTLLLNNYKQKESTSSVRNKISEQADATETIPRLLKDSGKLLKTQIDPIVYSLPDDQISFKQQYRENRRVLDLGHRYTTFKGAAKIKDSDVILSDVQLEFLNSKGEIFTNATDDTGKYRERLNPDTYKITATHPQMQPFIIEDSKILPGEMKIENLEMVPKP